MTINVSATSLLKRLILKAPITTAADDNFYLFIFFLLFIYFFFSEKTSLDITRESSAWQTIHMKCQDLFFFSEKKKIIIIIECCLLQLCLAL